MTFSIERLVACCLCLAAWSPCLAQPLEGSGADATLLIETMRQERREAKPPIRLYIRQKFMHPLARTQEVFVKGFERVYQDDPAPVKALEVAEDWQDVRDIMARYARKHSLAYIRFSSHGDQHGMVILPNSRVEFLEGISPSFAENAEVLIESCNVGRGLLGADYGERLGKILLGSNGGTIRLPRWLSFAGTSDWNRGSPMGYRTVLVLPGGQVRMSDPIDVESERKALVREIGMMAERLQRKINMHDKALQAEYFADALSGSQRLGKASGLEFAAIMLGLQKKLLDASPVTLHALADATSDLEKAIWAEESLPQEILDAVAEMLKAEDDRIRADKTREIERNGLPPGQFKYDARGQKVYQ